MCYTIAAVKAYIITAILCCITFNLLAKPNQSAAKDEQTATDHAPHAVTLINNQESTAKADASQPSSPKWYAALKRPDWWLVIIAALTGLAIAYQAKEMTHATKAMRQSMRLQEVALRQWVDIENWKAVPWIQEDGLRTLHIQFDVVNPTKLPLTLDSVFIMFDYHGGGEQGGKIGRKNLVPPGKGHPVVTSVKITEEQLHKWNEDKLVFIVNGHVDFEDVMRQIRAQPFSGMIVCSKKNGVVFIPPYGSGLYIRDTEKNEENPN